MLALSFAAAANPIDKFSPPVGDSRNFNMHLMRDLDASGQPQWPQGRVIEDPEHSHDWFHSDVRNMAVPYVYRVYETMLDIGELRSAAP